MTDFRCVTSDDPERDKIWAELSARLSAENCGAFDFEDSYYMFIHGWHAKQKQLNEALAQLIAGKSVSAEAGELLRIWQTWLGSSRDACDATGKQLWDRIDAVLATCS